MKQSGFTLIELLIVIALLGALAVGLLATVDPFEQLKKGQDTSTRNTASEIYNAAIRYYSVKNQFPWGGSAAVDVTGQALTDDSFTNASTGWLTQIITAGELKPDFIQLAGGSLGSIYITSTAIGNVRQNVTVCFAPGSKSFSNDPNSKYDVNGIESAGCPGAVGSCYWCLK